MSSEGSRGNVGEPRRSLGNGRIGEPGEKTAEPSRVAWSWDLAGSEAEDHTKVSAHEGQPESADTGLWQS